MKDKIFDFLKNRIVKSSWLLFSIYLVITIIITLFIIKWDKNSIEIENIFIFIIKLLPYFFALLAIGCLPTEKIHRIIKIILILLNFACMFCFFIPKLFHLFHNPDWEKFYLVTQMFVPFIILSLLLTYKFGGGRIKEVLVLGVISILFMLSGIEDLSYFFVNRVDIPQKWTWAKHMIVRLGKVPTKIEAFIFIGVHFLLIILVLFFAYSKFSPFLWKKNIKETESNTEL